MENREIAVQRLNILDQIRSMNVILLRTVGV